jgi:signal transduction histidine kinase
VILGRSAPLLEAADAEEAGRRHLDLIHKTAQQANALTRQLLAFSRKQVIAPEILDLNAVLLDMEPMLRRLVNENIELTIRLGREPAIVRIDLVQLQQVALNLAANARDAMPEGAVSRWRRSRRLTRRSPTWSCPA